jgi:kynureninase
MSQEKYIGMDVHQATISAAVMDVEGKLLMECVLETEARETLSTSGRRRSFFLTSLFIELIEAAKRAIAVRGDSSQRRHQAATIKFLGESNAVALPYNPLQP